MKIKLTVTIDRDLLPRAKRYARERGISLSERIEANLRHVSRESDGPSFSSMWRGRFIARCVFQPSSGVRSMPRYFSNVIPARLSNVTVLSQPAASALR